jgi:hypothetical protein
MKQDLLAAQARLEQATFEVDDLRRRAANAESALMTETNLAKCRRYNCFIFVTDEEAI